MGDGSVVFDVELEDGEGPLEILLFEFLAGLVRFGEVSAGENNVVAGLRGNGFGGCVSDTRIGSWGGGFGSVRIPCDMWNVDWGI